ncbi:MAG: ATP synthase F0 subunit C [Planctomycetota bacterium]
MTSMLRNVILASLAVAVFGTTFALAQDEATAEGAVEATEEVVAAATGPTIGRGLAVLGAGLAIVGAAIGIGLIGKAGAEATARQPEAGGRIFILALITAAFIEGATLFALVVAITAG